MFTPQENSIPTMNKSRASNPLKFNPLSLPCLFVDDEKYGDYGVWSMETMDIAQDWDDELEIEIVDDQDIELSWIDDYLSMSTSSPADDSCSMDYSFDLSMATPPIASDDSMQQAMQQMVSSMDFAEMCCAKVPRSSSKPEEDCVSLCEIQEIEKNISNDVILDRELCTENRSVLISSTGFSSGIHEWTITVDGADGQLQEIGVISNGDIDEFEFERGVFGARAIYGCELSSKTSQYASLNADRSVRCQKVLRGKHYQCGDQITVRLDADKGTIRFSLNGSKVRKVMSLERATTYYPFIAHSGYCAYSYTVRSISVRSDLTVPIVFLSRMGCRM